MWWALCGTVAMACVGRAEATEWTEDEFFKKVIHPYVAVASHDPVEAQSVIGTVQYRRVSKGDTFLDVARYFALGYNEIIEANPGVDEWVPPEDQVIILPTAWVLPQAAYEGIVVNIPEMRLYYFLPRKGNSPQLVTTFPVGLGRDDWRTPQGKFKIRGKTVNPTWNIPESIQKERIEKYGYSEKSIPGGDPENPLGKYRFELTLNSYGIHGTNIPWGVGMQVSHGCVRLYPEDIEKLFPDIPVGTSGEIVYQPVKIGARGGRIYADVSPDIYRLNPGLFREATRILNQLGWADKVDVERLQRAIQEKSGVPLDITRAATDQDLIEEDLRPTSPRARPAQPAQKPAVPEHGSSPARAEEESLIPR